MVDSTYALLEKIVLRDVERDVKMNILTLHNKSLLTTFTANVYVYIYIYYIYLIYILL